MLNKLKNACGSVVSATANVCKAINELATSFSKCEIKEEVSLVNLIVKDEEGRHKSIIGTCYGKGMLHACPNCNTFTHTMDDVPGSQKVCKCKKCSKKFVAKVGKYRILPTMGKINVVE